MVRGEEDPRCDFGTFNESPRLWDALKGLKHYHTVHTTDKITRFRDFNETVGDPRSEGPAPQRTPNLIILVCSDPEWIEKLQALIAPEFEGVPTIQ